MNIVNLRIKFLIIAVFALTFCPGYGSELQTQNQNNSAENLFINGDFEKGLGGINYRKWKKLRLPGYLDRENVYQGVAAFCFTDPKGKGPRNISIVSKKIDPNRNYRFTLALSCKNIAEEKVGVSIAQVKYKPHRKNPKNKFPAIIGWLGAKSRKSRVELMRTGGNYNWKVFTIDIPRKAFMPQVEVLNVYITHYQVEQGEVGVDALTLKPIEKVIPENVPTPLPVKINVGTLELNSANMLNEKGSAKNRKSQPAGGDEFTAPVKNLGPGLKVINYTRQTPCILEINTTARAAVRLNPDKLFYRINSLPKISIEYMSVPDGQLAWEIRDGFARIVQQKTQAITNAGEVEVKLPSGLGYYELIVRVTQDNQLVSETRRSIGVLFPPSKVSSSKDPFGLWIQGGQNYKELGVTWTRLSVHYPLWKRDKQRYLKNLSAELNYFHEQGISVLLYPQRLLPKQFMLTKKVIKDSPQAWNELEDFLTYMVKGLKGKVDIWAFINEPYNGMWKGNNPLIIKYWTLMHDIIEKYDPNTQLIGPSLNTNKSQLMLQLQNLLKMGFGTLVDGIELHTYTSGNMPEDINWFDKIKQTQQLVHQKTGSEKPLYSSEMGFPASYSNELTQAQYLVRSFLWAKRSDDLKFIIWHMFSWPQARSSGSRIFACFRNIKKQRSSNEEEHPQPRPAGVAYGVMTRQLAGATYKRELNYLGRSVNAFVFECADGSPLIAIWALGRGERQVNLPMQNKEVITVDLFGKRKTLQTQKSILTLTVDSSPVYLRKVDNSFLNLNSLVQVPNSITLIPASIKKVQFQLYNPKAKSTILSIKWNSTKDSLLTISSQPTWAMTAKEKKQIEVRIKADRKIVPGHYVVYGKLMREDKLLTSISVPIQVQPVVEVQTIQPTIKQGVPALKLQVKNNCSILVKAKIQVNELSNINRLVNIKALSGSSVILPLSILSQNMLKKITLNIITPGYTPYSIDGRYSAVPVNHIQTGNITIDGSLNDWSELKLISADKTIYQLGWGWNKNHIYLAVRVKDSHHIQKESIERMWQKDSIQFSIAPSNTKQWIRQNISEMHETGFAQFSIGLHQSLGAKLYRGFSPNHTAAPLGEVTLRQAKFAIKRQNGWTSYEVRLPVEQLGLKSLKSGQLLRGSVLINQNDGRGRKMLPWFGGIGKSRNSKEYGHLILQP